MKLHTFSCMPIVRTLLFSLLICNLAFADTFKSLCLNQYIYGKYGDHFFLDSTNAPGTSLPKKVKVMSQNFENLGIFKEKYRIKREDENGKMYEVKMEKTVEKSHEHKLRVAKRIELQDPDIIIGAEVKDLQSAQEYSRDYLGDKYQAILIEGNDGRGIDVCFFVKRSLHLDLEVQSYKRYSLTNDPKDPVFSRDFPVLLLRQAGAAKDSKPIMALAGTHLKSKLGDESANDKTMIKREEQTRASLTIYDELLKKYPGLPFSIGGDFNSDVRSAPEFAQLYKSGFSDVLDFDSSAPKKPARHSQYYFSDKNGLILGQLDAMFGNSFITRYILNAGIQRDVDANGVPTPTPKHPRDVNDRGSDHDGMFVVYDFETMVKDSLN